MQWLRNTPIAHRGLHDEVSPENSLSAFTKAIEAGYAIELDVHLSRDGVVMVFHDYSLERMSGFQGDIRRLDSSFLSSLVLLKSKENIPTLQEVLALINAEVPLLIEIKNEGKVGELESALFDALKEYKGKVAVQSFNPFSIAWFAKNAEHIPRGQLSGGFENTTLPYYKKFLLKNLLLNGFSKPHFIAYEVEFLPKLAVRVARLMKKPILAWTVRNEKSREYAKKYSDNIIFEAFRP